MSAGRLEAFSDAVIAVAITLLALELKVPVPGTFHGALAHKLGEQWPGYVAYAVSFLTIGIIWINHHAVLVRLREVDHAILIINLFLLMTVCVLPFTTNLMASYLNESSGEHLAAAVYAGSFLLMGLVFSVLNWQLLLRRPHLSDETLDAARRRGIFLWRIAGVLPYLIATVLAAVSAYATLVICAAVAIFYALPLATGER